MPTQTDFTQEAQRLTKALSGDWHGASGLAQCPAHADRTPSLSISPGRTTVLLHCFAGCDFTDVIRAIRSDGELPAGSLPIASSHVDTPLRDFAPLARKLWSEARSLPGTLAERYLHGRGISGPSQDLRFHPRTPIGSGPLVTFRPALIAAVRDNSGLVAVQRTPLDPITGGKATDLKKSKFTLGKLKGGAVRLDKAAHTLGIAEGIETARSAAAMLSIPVWAVLGAERLPLIEIPFDVRRLILLADRGAAGDRATGLALKAYAAPNRVIETLLPPDGCGDWNDADQARQGISRTC